MKEKFKNLFTGKKEDKIVAIDRKKEKRGRKGGKKKLLLLVLILLLILAAGAVFYNKKKSQSASAGAQTVNTASVERRDITSSLSSSGTINPKDTYSITSMAEGEIIESTFEEGDTVEAGQILYRIDASSMESKLKSAANSLERSRSNYETAVKDYNEAVSRFSGNTYKSTRTGYIKSLHIAEGDKVGNGGQIADIYSDQIMKIRVPFLNVEAQNIEVGAEAILTLSDTLEQISGTVTAVSSMDETLTGGRLIRYVTVQVENPGGLTTDMAATAAIGEFLSTGDGTFTPAVDSVMAADLSSNVEVEALLVNEGDYVTEGSPIFRMKASTAEKLIKSYKDSMDSAESSLEQAESGLDSTQDSYDNYTITAPISGTVIQKNSKVGDKVQNGNSATALAVIYDLSAVTFDMNIDELDISNVKVGQTVEITADAFENEKFTGKVTKVSLEGTSSNGVTYYPVTVTLDDGGGLLPGMNVDGEIVVEASADTLAVPADALMRGGRVYVKDDTVKEAQGSVPAGFRAVEVETGVISTDYVEIISDDIKEGDVVYVAKSSVGSKTDAMTAMPGGMGGMGGMGGAPGAPGGSSGGGSGRSSGGGYGGSGGGSGRSSGGSSGGYSRN